MPSAEPVAVAETLDDHAVEIRKLALRAGRDMVEIGRRLVAARALLPWGEWGHWVEREVGFSLDTAQRLVRVHELVAEKPQFAAFGQSVLYALSAPSTPEVVRERFAERAASGGAPSYREVTTAIKAARRAARAEATQAKADEPGRPEGSAWTPPRRMGANDYAREVRRLGDTVREAVGRAHALVEDADAEGLDAGVLAALASMAAGDLEALARNLAAVAGDLRSKYDA